VPGPGRRPGADHIGGGVDIGTLLEGVDETFDGGRHAGAMAVERAHIDADSHNGLGEGGHVA
jgi:hypothetical protein